MHHKLSYIVILLLAFNSCKSKEQKIDSRNTLFKPLTAEKTGLNFSNELTETEKMNIIQYLYFYNGAGVATGDINNDGLPDIYLAGNQVANQLYLNKGDLAFENISETAGVSLPADWSTGVNMADVNGDGFLDIYVCEVGNYKSFKGKNKLYINNGDLTFSEKADEYGLAFSGFSTQSLFFDFDRDGDLDMYLLNHAVHTDRSYGKATLRLQNDPNAGDRFFENLSEQGQNLYRDITDKAGIHSSHIGYGLGITAGDINNDGWIDIYIGNDFHENDYLYLNQGNGSFKEVIGSAFNHTSRFSMGSDLADINNDGLLDVMTMDMLPKDETILKTSVGDDPYNIYTFKLQSGYHYQFARNNLQINQGITKSGIPLFSDLGLQYGVAATDWSWSVLLADYDGDGWKDIFITNGILRRPNDLDYIKYHYEEYLKQGASESISDFELAEKMPQVKLQNFIYKNDKGLGFSNANKFWGITEKTYSNGASYADFDLDGDLDLVINNINAAVSFYENQADRIVNNHYISVHLKSSTSNQNGIGSRIIIKTPTNTLTEELIPTRGFMSSVAPSFTMGLGEDSLINEMTIIWPDQKSQTIYNLSVDQDITLRHEEAKENDGQPDILLQSSTVFDDITRQYALQYRHIENSYFDFNAEPLIPRLLSTEGPALVSGDINNDGLDDFFVGGAKEQPGSIYIQDKTGKFIPSFQSTFWQDRMSEDVDAIFADIDNDNDLDLIVGSGGNEISSEVGFLLDRVYINDGKGNFSKNDEALPLVFENTSCIAADDFDNDGDIDLFIGSRSVIGKYGLSPPSYLLRNDGTGKFEDISETYIPGSNELGMVTDAVWVDVNNDKLKDLVVVGEWMPVTLFINRKDGFEIMNNSGLEKSNGWWNEIETIDFDLDGDLDFVIGNLGLNSKIKVSSTEPAQLYINDFDNNGTSEAILCYYKDGVSYPAISRDKLINQLPYLHKKFVSYKDYGNSQITDIFSNEELDKCEVKNAYIFESMLIENTGTGFKMLTLPMTLQNSPIGAIAKMDVNQDGILDLIMGGNFYGVEPDIGRYDASRGHLLIGTKENGFKTMNLTESGFVLDGEIRNIITVRGKDQIIIAGQNDGPLQIFKLNQQ